jgi:Protein of unknown function (DUF2846)
MSAKLLAGILIIAFVLASGCASVPMASAERDAEAKAFSTTAGKANLYIYRNESMGAAVKMPVLVDSVSVGDTTAKTYILKQVDPGTHVVTSKSEHDATLSVDTVGGANYFIWQEMKMGMWSAGSALHQVDEAKGQKAVKECKLVN